MAWTFGGAVTEAGNSILAGINKRKERMKKEGDTKPVFQEDDKQKPDWLKR